MAFSITLPKNTVMGQDALSQSKDLIIGYGKKAFIVTGPIVNKTGLVKIVTDKLSAWGIEFVVFDEIDSEPTDKMISKGADEYSKQGCDFLIGIGGGSPLDAAKAINVVNTIGGSITSFIGKEINGQLAPMVLIPTTAGTGSEATKFTVITDTSSNVKMLLKGESLLPDLAIVDSEFSKSSPMSVTAATGMDALTHAVEAYTSRKANDIVDNFAVSAIKKIFKYLPIAYADGKNLEAREQLAIASYEAGVCINNSSVTIVHGMSRPIGALFHVPHGISNAMLIKDCLDYVKDGALEKFANLAKEIGVVDDKVNIEDAAKAFMNALGSLCIVLDIPTLKGYGIDKNKFDAFVDKMATDAINSGSPGNTVKEVTKEDLVIIYNNLWK